MGVSALNLGFCVLLCTAIVLGQGKTETPTMETATKSERPERPNITPAEEADQIEVDAHPDVLSPDPLEAEKHAKNIVQIRQKFEKVAKVLNTGRWKLGEVEVTDYKPDMLEKLNLSPYGPVKSVLERKGQSAVVSFKQPLNSKLVAKKLEKEMGIKAKEVWIQGGDFGHIEYNPAEKTYTFREGYDNCFPNCVDNHFWQFKFDASGEPKLDGEYATDIPMPPKEPEGGEGSSNLADLAL